MSFTHLGKRSKPMKRKIKHNEVELTTMGDRRIFTLRFGGGIASELDVRTGKVYQAWWGDGKDEGIIQLRSTIVGDPDAYMVTTPVRSGIAQLTISHLPESYKGRKFARAVVQAELIQPTGRDPAFIRVRLPNDFFYPSTKPTT